MPFYIPLIPFRWNVNSHLAKIPDSSLTLFHVDASSRETEAIMWHEHCHNTYDLSVWWITLQQISESTAVLSWGC